MFYFWNASVAKAVLVCGIITMPMVQQRKEEDEGVF